jgi:hypothetical protein
LLIWVSSCNLYIDKATAVKRTQVYQGNLTYYSDSNVLVFKSNTGIRMDKEKYYAKSFYTKLPKGLVSYQLSNAENFTFYYKKGQVLSIVIDLADSVTKRDSIYEPRKAEIEKYITHFTAGKNQKYNLCDIGYKQERRQAIIKKDAATILLYNIAPENYVLFVKCLKGFKFL